MFVIFLYHYLKHRKNRIVVTIPFNKINVNEFQINNNNIKEKTEDIIIKLRRDNPNITIPQLMVKTHLSEPGVKKNLKKLKDKNIIRRVGSKKNGYWDVI